MVAIMVWVPLTFLTFKLLALGTGMFFAIKWHYDQDVNNRAAVLRTGGKMAAAFLLTLLCVGLVTFLLTRTLGLDLSFL